MNTERVNTSLMVEWEASQVRTLPIRADFRMATSGTL